MTGTETAPRRIAIVEDDAHLRRYLREVVDADPRLQVIFTEGELAGATRRVGEAPVDLWLIDLQLPDGDGADLVRRLKAEQDVKCLILTVLGDRTSVIAALDSGADGYLLKDTDPTALVASIISALEGYAPISPQAAHFLLEVYQGTSRKTRPCEGESILSAREEEVLRLFSRGLSYREAAGILELSTHTVRDHVKAIYRKLSVHSRSEAVFEARQLGIISPSE